MIGSSTGYDSVNPPRNAAAVKKAMDDDFETVSKPSGSFSPYTCSLSMICLLRFSVFPAAYSVDVFDASRTAS